MDRWTLGLGVAAVAAVGAVVGVTISKHHQHTSRDDVAAYIKQVNAVQDDLRYRLTKVQSAYQAFGSGGSLGPQQVRQLQTAEQTLRAVQRRVARLDTPPQARRLRRLLLRLVGDETEITHEVALIAGFLPGFKAGLQTVHDASATLGTSLAKIHPPTPHSLKGTKAQVLAAQKAFAAASTKTAAAQADAVQAYDAQLQLALRRLSPLTPPPAFAPEYRAQVFTLRTTRVAGEKLAAGLRGSNRSDVATLGRAFTVASRKSQSLSAQRAEIAAIRAFNHRVKTLGDDAGAVRAEVTRLQRVLP